MAYQNEITFAVRYCETDRMGIVHHSRYFPWFEMGRCAFMAHTGYDYADMETSGFLVPVTQSGAKYHQGAQFGDTIILHTTMTKLGGARCRFQYQVLRAADKELLVEGFTEHGFVNEEFHPINAKKKHPEIWNALAALLDTE